MSKNTDLIEKWYASNDFNMVAADTEWHIAEGYPNGGEHHGRDSVREFLMKLVANFDEWKAVPDQTLDAGEAVVGIGHYRGRGKGTNEEFALPFTHVWWVRDNKIISGNIITDTLQLNRLINEDNSKFAAQ